MASIQFTRGAREDLHDLDGSSRQRVIKAIQRLSDRPEQRGRPLGNHNSTGNLTGCFKLKVGDIRVVFRIEENGAVVIIWVIGARRDEECYQLAVARLRMSADGEHAKVLEGVWESTR